MAYINAKEVKQIREELKKQYPDIKWSVSKEDSRNVNVCMLEGNIDFSDIETTGYFSINEYHLYKHPEHHQKLFNNIIDIIKTSSDRKWFDESDSMTDYFHTAFYFDLSVGKYQKPYINKAA